ncbi:TPA: hypothetical protein QCG78_003089 [Enterobacter asburiae]|nr:Bro-N domain-containing protein [Enterobacter asburiae]HEC5300557.1 hypothetical protein [Enterobacter asburiae]
MSTQLAFHDVNFNVVNRNGQIWLTSAELASALQYASVRAVTGLYNRYKDEFTESMSLVLKMNTKGFGGGNSEKDTRIFSLRGAHLVAMLSKTPVAKEFRRWVLDILDKEVGEPAKTPAPARPTHRHNAPTFRYIITLTYKDVVTGQEETFRGGANTPGEIIQGTAKRFGIFVSEMISMPVGAYY